MISVAGFVAIIPRQDSEKLILNIHCSLPYFIGEDMADALYFEAGSSAQTMNLLLAIEGIDNKVGVLSDS
jgi:folate-dependent phosphoribosylglycinamide formyltransferase PurN